MARQLNLWTGQPERDDSAERDLVYGSSRSTTGLVFVPRRVASELATIWRALDSSKTWGEFRTSIGHRIYRRVLERGQFDGAYSFASFQAELKENNRNFTEEEAAQAYRELPVGDRLPLDDDPFEMYSIDGVADGDWPDWPEQLMLSWMPGEILDQYGKQESSVLNGPFAVLDEDHEDEIVAALRRRGYRCVRDDELIARCSGA